MCAELGLWNRGDEFMEQTVIFSKRMRWLAVATGATSALALFPILFLLYPALLIAGGIIQPRFPRAGRWFVWAGAAELWAVLITYWIKVLSPHPFQLLYMGLTFSISTVLLIWCSAELVADGLNRLRARRTKPPARPSPVGWSAWIVAVVLNLVAGWSSYSLVSWHRQPGDPRLPDTGSYPFGMLLVTAAIVIAFDISLITRVVKLRSERRAEILRASS
jgi:hypothetical protein